MNMNWKEEAQARREGKIYCVETVDRPVPMLRVCLWDATEWSLPWSRFEAATYRQENESERIEIFFVHHQVTVVGTNLRETTNDIRAFQVRCLRDVPVNLHPLLNPTEPLIEKLEVRTLNEPKKPAPVTLPF